MAGAGAYSESPKGLGVGDDSHDERISHVFFSNFLYRGSLGDRSGPNKSLKKGRAHVFLRIG